MSETDTTKLRWDVFISYASEDRSLAEPLAEALKSLGIRVWYDRAELILGKSLRRSIDQGLSRCRRGIVILSKDFFSKHYPNRELDGLLQREVEDGHLILPIWHGVTASDVRRVSPPLADRVAVSTSDGFPKVVLRVIEAILPEAAQAAREAAKDLTPLPRLRTGGEIVGIVSGSYCYSFANEPPGDADELELISRFLQVVQDWGEVFDEIEIGDRVRAEHSITEGVEELKAAGWQVLGKRVERNLPQLRTKGPVALIFVARRRTLEVLELGNGNFSSSPRQATVSRCNVQHV